MVLSIIIPVFNEERTIHLILNKVIQVDLVNQIKKEIILVNDHSTDNSSKVIKDYISAHPEIQFSFYEHEVNKGKGAALHTGIKEASRTPILNTTLENIMNY